MESGDGGERYKSHKSVVNQCRREAEYFRQNGIEGSKFQFFIEKSNDCRDDDKNNAARVYAPCTVIRAVDDQAVEGGKSEFAEKYAVRVYVDVAGVAGDKNNGDTEEEGKYKSDGRIRSDKAASVQRFHKPDGEYAHERRTDDKKRGIQTSGEKKGENNPQKYGVADCVGEHGHSPEYKEVPRQSTADCRKKGNNKYFSKRIHRTPPFLAGAASLL